MQGNPRGRVIRIVRGANPRMNVNVAPGQRVHVRVNPPRVERTERSSVTLSPTNLNAQERLTIRPPQSTRYCNRCCSCIENSAARYCSICGAEIEAEASTTPRSPFVWKYAKKIQLNTDKPMHWNTSEIYLFKTKTDTLLLKKHGQEILICSLENGDVLATIIIEQNWPTYLIYPRVRSENTLLLYLAGFGFREFNPYNGELLREVRCNGPMGLQSHTKDKLYIRAANQVHCYDKDSLEHLATLQVNPVVMFVNGYNGDHIYFFINRPQLQLYRCERMEQLVNVDWAQEQLPFRAITSFHTAERCSIVYNENGADSLIILGGTYIKRVNTETGNVVWGYNACHNDFSRNSQLFNLARNLILIQSTIIQFDVNSGQFTPQPLDLVSIFKKQVRIRNASASGSSLVVLLDDSLHMFSSEVSSLRELCVRQIVQNLSKFYDQLHFFSASPTIVALFTKELKSQHLWTPKMGNLFKQSTD